MKNLKLYLLSLILAFGLQSYGQTTIVNKLVARSFVKKNDVTRLLVQDSITKEVGFILKTALTNRANQTGEQNISTVTGLQDSISDVNNRIDVLENIQGLKTNFTGQAYAIWSGSGLVYDVIYPNYYIEGVLYPGASVQITLNASDPTNPRQDIIAVDATGAIKITGDPSPDPAVPSIDTQTQIYISTVLIAAGATTPSGVVQDVIYKENVEWATSSDIATINFNATSSPYEGVKHIETDAFLAGKVIWFEDNVTHSIIDFDVVRLRIYLKATFSNNTKFIFYFFNGNNATSNIFVLNNGQYGFDRTLINQYQDIIIPISKFSFVGTSYDKFEIILTGGNATGFKIDNVLLDKGVGIIDPLQNAITSVVTNNGVVNSTNPDDTIAILGGDGNTVTSTGKTITVTSTVDLPFVKLNEGSGIGYVVKGREPLNYGNVGLRAVDLSSSTVTSAVNGATGTDSFAVGDRTRASGSRSFVSGQTNVVTGNDSASFGSDNTTAGGNSVTFGYGQSEAGYGNLLTGNGHLVTGGAYATVVGQFANSITNNIGNVNANTNTMFAVGNGTATGGGTLLARSTAFQVYRGGEVIAPTLTTAVIDAEATGKVLVTKEWVTANAGGGGGTTETASNGLTKTVDDIQLGGVLTANTNINGAGSYFLKSYNLTEFTNSTIKENQNPNRTSSSNSYILPSSASINNILWNETTDTRITESRITLESNFTDDSFVRQSVYDETNEISYTNLNKNGYEILVNGLTVTYPTTAASVTPRVAPISVNGVYADSSGDIVVSGGGTTETASNGLTKTVNDIKLGGTLNGNTSINGNYNLSINNSINDTTSFSVINTGSNSTGISGEGVFRGLSGVSETGNAVYGFSNNGGVGGFFESFNGYGVSVVSQSLSDNTVLPALRLRRGVAGVATTGLGTSIDFSIEADDFNDAISNVLESKWTNAVAANKTSEFTIKGVDNAVTSTLLTIAGNGNTTINGTIKAKAYTVATLPTGVQGAMAYVTDATAPTYLGTLTGGGSIVCPVFYNGTSWVSH